MQRIRTLSPCHPVTLSLFPVASRPAARSNGGRQPRTIPEEKQPMGCDIWVALGPATADGQTLFALNSHHHARQPQTLRRCPGRAFAPGEVVRASGLELPQARQTCAVLAGACDGRWGYEHGVNEHHLAAGYANWHSLLATAGP